MHRRPPLTVAPPPELVIFDPSEWADGWWDAFRLWGDARMAWVKGHPGSELGSALDVLKEHRRIREVRWREQRESDGAAS